MDAGHHSLVDPPMSPFVFVFSFLVSGSVFADAQYVLSCACIVGCTVVVALFIKQDERLFRERIFKIPKMN